MPNPLNISDALDLTEKGIKKVFIKGSMPHTREYTKKEKEELKKKGVKLGSKEAHKALSLSKKRKVASSDGQTYI